MPRTDGRAAEHRLTGRRLPVESIRLRLHNQGIVEIPRFLSPERALAVHARLSQQMVPADWTVAVRGREGTRYWRDEPSSRAKVQAATRSAREQRADGGFAYRFRRTFADHDRPCDCAECGLRQIFSGRQMRSLLVSLGFPSAQPGEIFASKYAPGDFLSPHHDGGNGRVAFVLNLSRTWRPEWGGLLHFLKDDWVGVRRTCTPTFNTLCLFDLPADRAVPHMVSQVVHGTRFAMTGWFGDPPGRASTR